MYFQLVMRYNFYVTVGQPAGALESYVEQPSFSYNLLLVLMVIGTSIVLEM